MGGRRAEMEQTHSISSVAISAGIAATFAVLSCDGVTSPAPSDTRPILFTARVDHTGLVMDADGSNAHRASDKFPDCGYDYRSVTWAPDGSRLAAECFWDVRIFVADSPADRRGGLARIGPRLHDWPR
jgi:hypothetical protein